MVDHEPILEPFAPETLEAIRKAFRAGWKELVHTCAGGDAAQTSNRLLGTIANLSRQGILDPGQLKDKALLSLGAPNTAPQSSSAGFG